MTSAPHVLHVLEALEGGTARHLVDVVSSATGSRHTVVVPPVRVGGLTDELATPRLRRAGASVELLRMHRTPWSPANAVALRSLRRLIRRLAPDVVHGHSSIGGLLARVAATGTGVPTAYTPNGITQVRAGIAVERALRRRTDAFVAVSTTEADHARVLGVVGSARLAVIPNGIEPEAPPAPLDLRAHLGIDRSTPLVGSIARLVPQKAPEDLIAAWGVVAQHVPSARFVLIGAGELEAETEAAVDALGIRDRFTRIPALADAAGVLDQLDVFSLASRFEGGPYAPLEAMRAGTAVVLTDVVGSRDTVEDGVSGVVVPVGEPAALGAAIVSLLHDGSRRQAIAAAGRTRVAERFTLDAMGAALDELYRELATPR